MYKQMKKRQFETRPVKNTPQIIRQPILKKHKAIKPYIVRKTS